MNTLPIRNNLYFSNDTNQPSTPEKSCTEITSSVIPRRVPANDFIKRLKALIQKENIVGGIKKIENTIITYIFPRACCVPLDVDHGNQTSKYLIYVPYTFTVWQTPYPYIAEKFEISAQTFCAIAFPYIRKHLSAEQLSKDIPVHIESLETLAPYADRDDNKTGPEIISRSIIKRKASHNENIVFAYKANFCTEKHRILLFNLNEPIQYPHQLLV